MRSSAALRSVYAATTVSFFDRYQAAVSLQGCRPDKIAVTVFESELQRHLSSLSGIPSFCLAMASLAIRESVASPQPVKDGASHGVLAALLAKGYDVSNDFLGVDVFPRARLDRASMLIAVKPFELSRDVLPAITVSYDGRSCDSHEVKLQKDGGGYLVVARRMLVVC